MINLPVFPVRTPEAFYEQLIASKPEPKSGKHDPAKMKAFLRGEPEPARALRVIKCQPVSPGFANSSFHSRNAFRFINAGGASIPVRWLLRPEQPFQAADTAPARQDKNYLFDALIAQINRQPLRWQLIIIIGQPGDPTHDATIAWPGGREQVDVGTLTLDRVESDDTSAARDINFDPLLLPAAIPPSDDPLPTARPAVYSQPFPRPPRQPQQPTPLPPPTAL